MSTSKHQVYGLFTLAVMAVVVAAGVSLFVLLPSQRVNIVLVPLDAFLQTHMNWVGLKAGKLGHIGVFCLLGAIGAVATRWYGVRPGALFALAAGFAVCTELAQIPIAGRTASVLDFFYDMSGFTIGYLLVMIVTTPAGAPWHTGSGERTG